jgi:hypothetical protein
MKRVLLVCAIVLVCLNAVSCTPESQLSKVTEQACCGDDGNLPPPPPPPPPGDGD